MDKIRRSIFFELPLVIKKNSLKVLFFRKTLKYWKKDPYSSNLEKK